MKQMYLLTVITNLAVGLGFILPWLSEKYPFLTNLKDSFSHISFKIKTTVAIFLAILGLMKLLFFSFNMPVLGDLIPACTLILASLVFTNDVLQEKPNAIPMQPNWTNWMQILKEKETIIGFLCLTAALLHFLAADILFF